MSRIFIPGQGVMSFEAARVSAALKAYDRRLFFKQHPDTNDWCVFVEMPSGEPPYPVVGWPEGYLPDVNTVMERIKEGDTLRNGDRMYNEMLKSQQDHKLRLEAQSSEASEVAAEMAEFAMRKQGLSPVIKVFMGGGDSCDS